MTQTSYAGQKVLVVGLGASGLAACRYLLSQGASVCANDSRARNRASKEILELEAAGCRLWLGGHPLQLLDEVELMVLSPGVPLRLPLIQSAMELAIPVWSELELGFRALKSPTRLVAVTGTKGKSTTATLIDRGLKAAGISSRLVGNIGRPIVEEVERMTGTETLVVEASSFQLATIDTFRPDVAVLVNLSPDHLDWHPDFDDYVSSKRRIFENQREQDSALVYGGSALTRSMAKGIQARVSYFALEAEELLEQGPVYFREDEMVVRRGGSNESTPLASCSNLSIPGDHNIKNFIAAVATLDLLGVEAEAASRGAVDFEGLEHALEFVAELGGVRYVNDSKATQLAAVEAAIQSFEAGTIHLILGGRAKGGDFHALRPLIEHARAVYAFGESTDQIRDALSDLRPVGVFESLESIVQAATNAASPGEVILFSPGGSSFDLFDNYRHRGKCFKDIVRALVRSEKTPLPGNDA